MRFATSLLLLVGLSGVTAQELTPLEALAQAEARWKAQKPAEYEFSVRFYCRCTLNRGPRFHVTGTDSRPMRDMSQIERDDAASADTIEDLFELIRASLSRTPDLAEIQYHPELGYPVSVRIDQSRRAADEELGFNVYDFLTMRPRSAAAQP